MRSHRSFLNRILILAALPFLALAAGHAASPAEKESVPSCPPGNWGYAENNGPDKWPELSPCNCQCAKGGEQSPINIVNPQRVALPSLVFSYGTIHDLYVEHNGHEIQAKVLGTVPRQGLRIGNVEYDLVQFHFHTPSEHEINGREVAPIEMHLLHSTPGGRQVVVGVFIQPGPANPELTKIWDRLPMNTGDHITVGSFNLAALLPSSRVSYRYQGSLTSPACRQGVQWSVLARPITMDPNQITKLRSIFFRTPQFPKGNIRPVQPLEGRTVLTDVPAGRK